MLRFLRCWMKKRASTGGGRKLFLETSAMLHNKTILIWQLGITFIDSGMDQNE